MCSMLENLSVCLTEAYSFPASAGGFWIDRLEKVAPSELPRVVLALVQPHAPS